ncbi:hypothetical protein [uncultured Enterovirga sp.]|uniref:hypothetical protein n=1 Tax=uncultured Enterovirga sp. TaxID=2026352 RepID=UPI0035CA5784
MRCADPHIVVQEWAAGQDSAAIAEAHRYREADVANLIARHVDRKHLVRAQHERRVAARAGERARLGIEVDHRSGVSLARISGGGA